MNRFATLCLPVLLGLARFTDADTYHVAQSHPSASDESPGTQEEPWKTISRAASALRPGDTVVIHAGVYREHVQPARSGFAEAPITYAAAKGEDVVITGADIVSGWTPAEGGAWKKEPWTHRFPTHPDDERHRLVGRCEQVIVDGSLLRQVESTAELQPGTFCAVAGDEAIHVRLEGDRDPSGHRVECSVRTVCFGPGWGREPRHHIELRGVTIRYAANMAQRGALYAAGDGWRIEDCTVEWTNGTGITFVGNDVVLRRVRSHHHGQQGASGSGRRFLLEDVVLDDNNLKGFDTDWEAGAIKITHARDGVLRRSSAERNDGNAFWFDIDVRNVVVEDCVAQDNGGHGIFVEISGGFEIRNNLCVRNGLDGKWGRGGIAVGESDHCTIEHNTCRGNPTGISIREQGPRSFRGIDGTRVTYRVHDITIRRNVCAANKSYQFGLWWDNDFFGPHPSAGGAADGESYDPDSVSLRLHHNVYGPEEGQRLTLWGVPWRGRHREYRDLAAWQGERGQDEGTVVAEPALARADPLRWSDWPTWEEPPRFSRTYHVNRSHPRASDEGTGTEEQPFRTISRAAEALQPGERVIVAAGVYHERIRPPRGGTGADAMISYEAAPGATVVLKGSVPLRADWQRSEVPGKESRPGVWQTRLEPSIFEGYNPFDIENVTETQFESMSWAAPLRGKPPCTLVRGLVFQEGMRLGQVAAYEDLSSREGSYWVDRPRQMLHLRPLGAVDPRSQVFEVTTRETVFAPELMGLGYIRVKGFTIEQVAGPWPWEQVGAISTTRGHHWIIEDNSVRQVNGVGIDVGIQHPRLPQPETVGHHIVRNNLVADCGICGICGLGPGQGREFGLRIEDNVLLRNAFFDIERLFETGGIKTHNNVRCCIRRNRVEDTLHGPGIWMDWDNRFSRCSENIIVGTRTMHGAIFVEASYEPNLIAQNEIWDSGGHGIYEHDSTSQIFAHNFIGRTSGSAFHLNGKVTDRRIAGREIESGRHVVRGNVVFSAAKESVFRGPGNVVDGNVFSAPEAHTDSSGLMYTLPDTPPTCVPVAGLETDPTGAPRPRGAWLPGPLARP